MNSNSIIKKIVLSRKKLIFSIAFFTLVTIGLRISVPLLLKNLIDDVIDDGVIQTGKTLYMTLTAVGFLVLAFIFDGQRILRSSILGHDITMGLSEEAYSSVLRAETLDLQKLDNEDLMDKIINKSNQIGNLYVGRNVLPFFYESLFVLGILITMLVTNYWFFGLTLLAMPLYYFITKQLDKLSDKRAVITSELQAERKAKLKENLEKIKNIKLLNGIKNEEEAYAKLIRRVEKSYRKEYGLGRMQDGGIIHLLTDLLLTSIIGIGAFLFVNDSLELGSLIVCILFVPAILPSMRKVMNMRVMPYHTETEREALDEILVLKPENRADTVQQLDEIYSLKFKDVAYDYGQGGKFNMEEISFEIKKGEKLGILGLSSSGKTTITDLITKVIRPKQGSVQINNCDLNKINTYYLRELISIVPQDFKLLNGTIEYNITYPLPFDEYKYNDAMNRCRLKSVVSGLENREQTVVSHDTKLLTPAEKQKIALANAFYKDAKIFVFDESTSKMDHTTEADMMSEIFKLKNKLTLIISNRIYNLTKCDKILILNNGRILEYGKTSELLDDSKSTFAKMMKEHEQSKIRVG